MGSDPGAGPAGTWTPLRNRTFRALWVAALVSNLGSWMHLVAAGWLMSDLTAEPSVVALLQTAASLPAFLLALPAGALADVVDRRRLILATQGCQLIVAAALAGLSVAGAVTPALLLLLTVLLGASSTLGLPAYSAVTADVVDRTQLPAAISLNSVVVTASQAVGPAIGGGLVAAAGPGAVFALNAVSFVAVLWAVAAWRPATLATTLPAEHVAAAVRTGLRYTANAPQLIGVLVRSAAYVAGYSALPALLVVVTRERLGGDAGDYGILLGLLGVGGVGAALVLPALRRRVHPDVLVVVATGVLAAVLATVAVVPSVPAAAPLLALAGAASMTTMSSLNIAAQQLLPGWFRGRGLAVFQLVFQATFAGGAAAWGLAGTALGLPAALAGAAGVLLLGWVLVRAFPLDAADRVDVRPAYRDEPHVDVPGDLRDGPVLATRAYTVPEGERDRFLRSALRLRSARRREGAYRWALYVDTEHADRLVESYLVASWAEHERERQRRTVDDLRVLEEAAASSGDGGGPRYHVAVHLRRDHER